MRYSLSTCLYFLLRHKVDATELDEVWVPEVEREEPPVPAAPNESSDPGHSPEPADASPDAAEGSEPKSE
jgi:hypothetical protein